MKIIVALRLTQNHYMDVLILSLVFMWVRGVEIREWLLFVTFIHLCIIPLSKCTFYHFDIFKLCHQVHWVDHFTLQWYVSTANAYFFPSLFWYGCRNLSTSRKCAVDSRAGFFFQLTCESEQNFTSFWFDFIWKLNEICRSS